MEVQKVITDIDSLLEFMQSVDNEVAEYCEERHALAPYFEDDDHAEEVLNRMVYMSMKLVHNLASLSEELSDNGEKVH